MPRYENLIWGLSYARLNICWGSSCFAPGDCAAYMCISGIVLLSKEQANMPHDALLILVGLRRSCKDFN